MTERRPIRLTIVLVRGLFISLKRRARGLYVLSLRRDVQRGRAVRA